MNALRTSLLLAVAISFVDPSVVQAQIPAFSGADGPAQRVSGGRGGIVYHVTKLNAALDDPDRSAPGTLLYGLNDSFHPANTPRTIVFDVAGVIHLGLKDTTNWTSGGNAWDSQSRLGISARNITIAGETAPGPVIIMGGTLKPAGTNVIIRNLTMAPGYGVRGFWQPGVTSPTPGSMPTQYRMAALDISGQHILIDHVSGFFSSQSTMICGPTANHVSIQHCNTGLPQTYNRSTFAFYLQGNPANKVGIIRNMVSHESTGIPLVGSESGTGAHNDFRNNLIHNWLGDAGYGIAFTSPSLYSKMNFLHNFYLSGEGGDYNLSTVLGGGTGTFYGYQSYGSPVGPAYTSVYPSGNLIDINQNRSPLDTANADGTYLDSVILASAYDVSQGVTVSATAAFTNILRHVGARWWERDYDFRIGNTNAIDSIDERLIHNVMTGTGRIEAWADDPFDSDPNEGTEWRALWALRADTNGVAPFNRPPDWDVDGDGMPAAWELDHGLDPAVANNNGDFDQDGYTDLEDYLQDIASWPAPGEIMFTGTANGRYAQIENWKLTGATLNISGLGPTLTSSPWQPSRHDTAIIDGLTAVVDAAGQHAGTLKVQGSGTLTVSNGWLKIARSLEIGTNSVASVNLSGGYLRAATLNRGPAASFNFTGGRLSADVINFDLLNQGGTIAPGESPGHTRVNGHLTLLPGSILELELGAANTNDSDSLTITGDLALGGLLNITGLDGFGEGTYTLLTYGGSLSGAISLGATPAGYGYLIDTSVPNLVQLTVISPPAFDAIMPEGSTVIMTAHGPANRSFELLSSIDPAAPINAWTLVATNAFDATGHFIHTNSVNLIEPSRYYILRIP